MMRVLLILLVTLVIGQGAVARPLVLSSETSLTRICLDGDESEERLFRACQGALDAGRHMPRTEVRLLKQLGSVAHDLGHLEIAAARLGEAIALAPDDAEAHALLGWLEVDRDRPRAARKAFEAALEAWPLAIAEGGLAWLHRHADDDVAAAREALDRALLLSPDYTWALRERAWNSFDAGNLTAAQADFEAALKEDDEDANALYGLSLIAEEGGDLPAAFDWVNSAILSEPEEAYLYVQRASLHFAERQFRAAKGSAERAIALDPDEPDGYVQRAFAEEALGHTADALATYQAAVARGIADNRLRYWHASLLAEEGDLGAAATEIDAALDLPGADGWDFELKAYIALEREEAETAREAARAALDLMPDLDQARYYLAVADLRLGEVSAAMEGFSAAAELGLDLGIYVDRFVAELVRAGKSGAAIGVRLRFGG